MLKTRLYQIPTPPRVCALIRWDFIEKYVAYGTWEASRYQPTELVSDVDPFTSAAALSVLLKFCATIGQAGVKYSRSPTLLGEDLTGSSLTVWPGEPCPPPGPTRPGGDANDRPEKKERRRKDIIRILYLFLGKKMFICIGLVHELYVPECRSTAARYAAMPGWLRVTIYYKRECKVHFFDSGC
jgi:hypothetical protein